MSNNKTVLLAATVKATEWRTKYRRQRNRRDNEANARAVDTLMNFETVKYYAATDYERACYETAILDYQVNFCHMRQSTIFFNQQ